MKKNIVIAGATVVCLVLIVMRLMAIYQLPMIGDEPDDLNIIICDVSSVADFFHGAPFYGPDQSRLPFNITLPFVYLLQEKALVPVRIMFLLFHLGYIFLSYRIVSFLTGRESPAWMYVLLLLVSCFIASFSIFTMTTSDNLYLLFHIATLGIFLKSYQQFCQDQVFPDYLLLAFLLALCISSKLFGVLLLVALFIFHLVNKGRNSFIWIPSVPAKKLLSIGAIFLSFIILLNIVPVQSKLKLVLALGASLIYLCIVGIELVKERLGSYPVEKIGFLSFWVTLVLTSFNLTLILSPIYLNLRNIIDIFSWFGQWGAGPMVARSNYYDMFVIIIMKFGFVSSLVLVIELIMIFLLLVKVDRVKIASFFRTPMFLFIVVFAIHFIVISMTKHKVTWYPLAIFPFLYLPTVWLWNYALKKNSKILRIAVALFFIIIFVDNGSRYIRWFPYGHFDGAQYGREYIGWNRAGFVSYEIFPQLLEAISSYQDAEKKITFSCQVSDVPLYNKWVATLLQHELNKSEHNAVSIVAEPLVMDVKDEAYYVLTSPIYYPGIEPVVDQMGKKKIEMLSIKGVHIISIWGE